MRLKRGELAIGRSVTDNDKFVIYHGSIAAGSVGVVMLSPDDLRWLCLVAGPALLNELGKEATRGDD
jgi:hypothetical protein